MSAVITVGRHRLLSFSDKIDGRVLTLAVIIFMVTLKSDLHIYLIGSLIFGSFWLAISMGLSQFGFGDIRLSRPVILICTGVGIIVTGKAITAVVAGETGAGGYITFSNFVNRWGTDILWLGLLFLLAVLFTSTSRHVLQQAIRLVLTVHVVGFLLQLLVYYLFGYLLDFSSWLGGPSARTGYLTFFRPTGFSFEPSTVAGIMIVLLACDALVARRVSVRFTVLVAALCILSFSTAAWIFAAFMLLIILPVTLKSRWLGVLSLCLLMVMAGVSMQSKYAQVQVAKFEDTSSLRSGVLSYIVTERPAWENLIGPASNGMSLDYLQKGNRLGGGRKTMGAASTDGTAVYLSLLYGMLGLCAYLVFFVFAFKRLTFPVFLLLFLTTMTKLTPATTLFTVLAAAVCVDVFPNGRRRRSFELESLPCFTQSA